MSISCLTKVGSIIPSIGSMVHSGYCMKQKGEKWYDFDAIRLERFAPEIWLVPLTGHTPGHMGVAVKREQGWVLHGGDAVPFDMKVEEVNEWNTKKMLGPHLPRIREFRKAHPEVQIVGSHMSPGFYEKG